MVSGPIAERSTPQEELEVLFPRRISRFGILFFSVLLALFVGWVRHAEETPWLAVVAGTGCFLGALISLGQYLKPKVLARADASGLTIYTRRLKEGESRFLWQEVQELSYEERQVGQFLHKVVRLDLGKPVDGAFRQIADEDTVAHLDAFAAEPGGRELLERLEVLRSGS